MNENKTLKPTERIAELKGLKAIQYVGKFITNFPNYL